MNKCVAYCRVSTDSLDQLNSLTNQVNHYTQLFKKTEYIPADCGMYYSRDNGKEVIKHIPAIFADEGISGTKLKNREAFKYMIQCAYKKEFEIIYVKNIQRWARSVSDGSKILKDLKVVGVKVIFEDGNLNNFDHEMVINVLLSTAQEESRAKSKAVQFGIRKAQENGKYTSYAPYGYTRKNGFLERNENELDVVKKIFDFYVQGWGGTRISKYLNEKEILTKKNKRWTQTQIYDIIKNCIYTGKQITHKVVNTDINVDRISHTENGVTYNYSSRQLVDESKWFINQYEELRVISDETYDAAQEEYARRKELNLNRVRPSIKHIFSNLLYCHNCNRALRRKKLCTWKRKDGTRAEKYEWVCVNHDMYYNDICQYRNSWEEQTLIQTVIAEIRKLQEDKALLDIWYEKMINAFLSNESTNEKIGILSKELHEVKNEISTNLKLLSRNIIDENQYKEQNDVLQKQRSELENEINKLNNIEIEKINANKKYKNFCKTLDTMDLDNLDNVSLKKIINSIIAYTFYDNGKEVKSIDINWKVSDKSISGIALKELLPIS